MGYVRRFAEPRLLMTAAMAFFSIAMTLNLTGVRLSDLRLSDLRPSAVRSFMERRLTMASTPIIRYYDHSRLVYEVQIDGCASCAGPTEGEGQGEGEDNRQKPQEPRPANPNRLPGTRMAARGWILRNSLAVRCWPCQPTLNDSDFLETSLTFQQRSAHSGGSRKEIRERSTIWTA